MTRLRLWVWGFVCLLIGVSAGQWSSAFAAALDSKGEITLGARTYTSARVASERTDSTFLYEDPSDPNLISSKSFTFPIVAPGHLFQHRYFAEIEVGHDLTRLLREGFGPFALLNDLPFEISELKYKVVYRGEGEGVYDYGPSEFSTSEQYFDRRMLPSFLGQVVNVPAKRKKLRQQSIQRHRLFQAFLDVKAGDLFVRVGRQILAWGETDAFRLLDNINPLDSSFGGFLISIDERRVPLDMLRASYALPTVGPFSEAFIEMFAAVDDKAGWDPGAAQGSAWSLPNLGAPSKVVGTERQSVPRSITAVRGGGQLRFNAPMGFLGDGTVGLAHYYTYFDNPAIQQRTNLNDFLTTGNSGALFQQCGDDSDIVCARQSAPRVQVTGVSSTFTIPSRIARHLGVGGEPVMRTELAYFNGEPRFRQSDLDPFIFNVLRDSTTSGPRTGQSWNFVLGMDLNQPVRWLNSRQSILFSTQFFFKHLIAAAKRAPIYATSDSTECFTPGDDCEMVALEGEVLPVPESYHLASNNLGGDQTALHSALEPDLVHNPVNQYLQTLVVATSYYSGQVNPSLTLFYDWGGAFIAQPSVTLIRDPFRFTMQYNFLAAGRLKGASGVSLLRDRDNVLFQLEYVI